MGRERERERLKKSVCHLFKHLCMQPVLAYVGVLCRNKVCVCVRARFFLLLQNYTFLNREFTLENGFNLQITKEKTKLKQLTSNEW